MRGGRFQVKNNEDVNMRNAEALFETQTVVEIREVEMQTRKEIEERKEELRQLVGASYRDLIESADSILLMKQSCEAVASNMEQMEQGFECLKKTISVNVASPAVDRDRKRREKLYGIGSRVKYLVDTPEKIWGCLDEHMYLEAAERYLRAKEVYLLLLTENGHNGGAGGGGAKKEEEELLANFPLLRQQWPLIETFRVQISQRSKDRLQEPGLNVRDYAVALAAGGIIDELPSSDIFSLFLESRKAWLRTHLRAWIQDRDRRRNRAAAAAASGEEDVAHTTSLIATALCKLVHIIQGSLGQVGVLFLEASNGKVPLFYTTVLAAPPGSQLFGGIPYPEEEVRLWKMHREKLENSVASLSGAFITDACVKWLRECAREISVEAAPLVKRMKSGRELAEIEKLVRDDLGKQETLIEFSNWLQNAFGAAIDSPWDCVCELLLKAPTDLWKTLFESLFVARMREVVDSGFASINIMEMAKSSVDLTCPTASNGNYSHRAVDINCGDVQFPWKLSTGQREWEGDAPFFLPEEVTKVKDKVDAGLRELLLDFMSFLQGPQGNIRKELLAPFLQEQCFNWVSAVVSELGARLSKLSELLKLLLNEGSDKSAGLNGHGTKTGSTNGRNPLKVVEQVLFIGRLCTVLEQHSVTLPILLGSPSSWIGEERSLRLGTIAKGSTSLLSQNSWFDSESSPFESSAKWFSKRWNLEVAGSNSEDSKFKELQQNLRQQSIAAHQMWVQWSTEGLAKSLLRDIQKDECLSTSTSLKGWEETILKSPVEGGEEVELRMPLPAMPSSYAVAFLFAACQEIRCVGGHVLDRAVLQLFAWQLSEKVLVVYDTLVSNPTFMNLHVSEKGLLQLLFDLKLVADVLSGGQDISHEGLNTVDSQKFSGSLLSSVGGWKLPTAKSDSGRKKRVALVLSKLQSRLDPIDWAIYESCLWEHELRYYQRCAVLFGVLIQLQRLHTDASPKLPSNVDTNTLDMSVTVPRFTYLPISAPVFSGSGASPLPPRRSSMQEDRKAATWEPFPNNDDASKFVFTDSLSLGPATSAKPLLQSLMGQMGQVGSKFNEGTLKLGSILSDGQVGRLKDKSAAAISTFGDMLPVQAAGLFSSLTASSSKLES